MSILTAEQLIDLAVARCGWEYDEHRAMATAYISQLKPNQREALSELVNYLENVSAIRYEPNVVSVMGWDWHRDTIHGGGGYRTHPLFPGLILRVCNWNSGKKVNLFFKPNQSGAKPANLYMRYIR